MEQIDEYLITAREVAKLALEGKTDKQIADEVGINEFRATELRRGMGFKRSWKIDITKDWKKAKIKPNSSVNLNFTIPIHLVEDLGIKHGQKVQYTGKIANNMLTLKFKPV